MWVKDEASKSVSVSVFLEHNFGIYNWRKDAYGTAFVISPSLTEIAAHLTVPPLPLTGTRCRLQQPQKSVRLKGCSRDSVHATTLWRPHPWQSTIGSEEIAELLITESGVQTEQKFYIIYFNDSIINCSLLVDKYGTFTRKTRKQVYQWGFNIQN